MNNSIIKQVATAAALLAATQTYAAAITVDGILSATDDYTHVLNLDYVAEGGTEAHTGTLRLVQSSNSDGSTGGSNDIFALYEVPTGIHDLTWGDNRASGWGSTSVDYGNIQGSEKLYFDVQDDNGDARSIEVKMKDTDNGIGNGYDIGNDGDGALLAASTSLDYNIKNVTDYATFADSDNPVFCTDNSSDAACYASASAGLENYQFAQIYEMQFDGNLFTLNSVADFILRMSNSNVHASPAKNGSKTTYTAGCVDTNSCTSVEVPTPPIMGLLLAVFAGLGVRRTLRK